MNVFTHKSLRQPNGNDDNERYAVLGEKAFEAAVAYCIFLRNPQLRKESAEEVRAGLVSDMEYAKWVDHYGLFEKLRFNPANKGDVHSKEGTRELFHAYLGAVYSQPKGPMILNAWVFRLLTPPQEHHLLPDHGEHDIRLSWSPHYAGHGLPQSDSLPIKRRRSRTSHSTSPSPPVNPASLPSTTVYLPRFNEIVTKKRFDVQWPAKQSGPQHAPRWEINCLVNGSIYGSGVGTTKQLAKEEAALHAFFALGFDRE